MAVQVQDCTPALALGACQPTGGQGGVVEVAVAPAVVAPGVVARRAAERIGAGLAGQQQVGTGQGAGRGAGGGPERAGHDGRLAVEQIPSAQSGRGRGSARGAADREDVRDGPLVGIACIRPRPVGAGQVVHVVGGVQRAHVGERVHGRGDDLMAGMPHGVERAFGAFGRFPVGDLSAEGEAAGGRVAAMPFGVDDLHGVLREGRKGGPISRPGPA